MEPTEQSESSLEPKQIRPEQDPEKRRMTVSKLVVALQVERVKYDTLMKEQTIDTKQQNDSQQHCKDC